MAESVILIGAGGHGKVIADAIIRQGDKILGFLDDNKNCDTGVYSYLGEIEDFHKYALIAKFVIAIGENRVRKTIAQRLFAKVVWKACIHPSAQVGSNVHVGEGTVVMANSVINASVKIGKHCIINTGAVVEHDSEIGDYVHISPRSVLGGNVKIGEATQIGIGAVVKNNLIIVENCLIGAGATVVDSLQESGVYIGVPAHRKKEIDV